MAVMAILAAVLAPSLVASIDGAVADAEASNLATIATELRRYTVRNRAIPAADSASWSNALATLSDLSAEELRNNRRRQQRALYVDPRFFSASASSWNGYTQSAGLTNPPFSPRMMLVSNLKGSLPAAPGDAAAFDAIWNQSSAALVVEGEQLLIQRINFAGLFHRLLLVNESTSQAGYALESVAQQALPTASGGSAGMTTVYVIDKTRLGVYDDPYPSGSLATAMLVGADTSLRYTTNGSSWYWTGL